MYKNNLQHCEMNINWSCINDAARDTEKYTLKSVKLFCNASRFKDNIVLLSTMYLVLTSKKGGNIITGYESTSFKWKCAGEWKYKSCGSFNELTIIIRDLEFPAISISLRQWGRKVSAVCQNNQEGRSNFMRSCWEIMREK